MASHLPARACCMRYSNLAVPRCASMSARQISHGETAPKREENVHAYLYGFVWQGYPVSDCLDVVRLYSSNAVPDSDPQTVTAMCPCGQVGWPVAAPYSGAPSGHSVFLL